MKKQLALSLSTVLSLTLATTAFAEDIKGQGVYMNFCAPCHTGGIAGAPKVGDKDAWQDRLGKGPEAIADLAIKGFQGKSGFMPAKGGNSALTDEEVTAATEYMLEQIK